MSIQERLSQKIRSQGLRFNKANIPDDVYGIIKRKQAQLGTEKKSHFSLERTIYAIVRESEVK